jgi:hypothetical protein
MKYAADIVKYGRPKPYFDKAYNFVTLDLETINNELFMIGTTVDGKHECVYENFRNYLNDFFIFCVQHNKDILTWSRYDNTFIIKTLISPLSDDAKRLILLRIRNITPLFDYDWKGFKIEITNVIKENVIITIYDHAGNHKKINVFNLKNLFADVGVKDEINPRHGRTATEGLEQVAWDYGLDYYSKTIEASHALDIERFNEDEDYRNAMLDEFHKIDLVRFNNDPLYKMGVIESNRLDNIVLVDIANKLLENFHGLCGVYPKTIYTAGSLARSYLLTIKGMNFNFHSMFAKSKLYDKLLDYSMKSYHGGKIESYVIGYIAKATAIDISSAYPYSLSQLPKPTGKAHFETDINKIKDYYYAFIDCTVYDVPDKLIHPISIPAPIGLANISPSGTFEAIITKPEYDFFIRHGIKVEVRDFIGVESTNDYPYKDMIQTLFDDRLKNKKSNPSLAGLLKTILNSLYGITFELNDVYEESGELLKWEGLRAGDFFNPIIASYITALTRTYLSEVGDNILDNGGDVYLNMTDSIIYKGEVTLDVFSDKKTLGKFEKPEKISEVLIMGAGRYEYLKEGKYIIKTRGFNARQNKKSYYSKLDLTSKVTINHSTLVTFYRATQNKYKLEQLGHLIEEPYIIDPMNLGGKRIIDNRYINMKKEFTTTRPVRMSLDYYEFLPSLQKDADVIKRVTQFRVKKFITCEMCGKEIPLNEYAYRYTGTDGRVHYRCVDHKPIHYGEYSPFAEENMI